MHEAEEIDTCRICSGAAEPGQPLFHPCKCSGTIRYIHQDCLTTWLAHSKKKSCDVCKHPYSFTKVYAMDMPNKLPVTLIIRRTIQQFIWGIVFVIRAFGVGAIWLAILPLMTVWTWRMYFSMGDYTAWWISNRHRPTAETLATGSHPPPPTASNVTHSPFGPYFHLQISGHPLLITLSSDIFTGQIIASIIVLTFVAIFLLREWISQNARPGVFEDEDMPEEAIPPPPPPVVQRRIDEANELPEQLARRQVEAIRALEDMRAAEAQHGVGRDGRMVLPHWQFAINDRPVDAGDEQPPVHPLKRRRKRRPTNEVQKPAIAIPLIPESERLRKKAFNRRLQAARMSGTRRKLQMGGTLPLIERELDERDEAIRQGTGESPFEFTFRPPEDDNMRPTSAPPEPTATSNINESQSLDSLFPPTQPSSSSTTTLPFSLSAITPPPPPDYSPPRPPPFEVAIMEGQSTSSTATPMPRRPPLPTVTLPPVDFATQPLSTSSSTSRLLASPPLSSPSLATYRAPEQLNAEAGPSNLSSYFAPRTSGLGLDTHEVEGNTPEEAGPSTIEENDENVEEEEGEEEERDGLNIGAESSSLSDWIPLPEDAGEEDTEEEEVDNMTPQQLREARNKYFSSKGKDVESIPESVGDIEAPASDSSSGDEDAAPQDTNHFLPEFVEAPLPNPRARPPVYGGVLVIGADETDDENEDEPSEEDEDDDGELPDPIAQPIHVVQPDLDGGVNIVFNPVHAPRPAQNNGHVPRAQPAQGGAVQPNADANPPLPAVPAPALPDVANGNAVENAAIDAALLAAVNEDLDINAEDDMEGALEAIGMRGPIHGVIQNAAVMIFVLHMAIGLGVWLPYTIGKSVALLVLEPYRCLQILHLPIKAIRIVTDPIVDTSVWIITRAIFPFVFRLIRRQSRTLLSLGMVVVRIVLGQKRAATVRHAVDSASEQLTTTVMRLTELPSMLLSPPASVVTPSTPIQSPSTLQRIVDPLLDRLGPAEPYFEAIGKEVRTSFTQTKVTWEQLAEGSGPKERAFAVVLGYFAVSLLLAVYLNVLTVGSVKKAHKAIRSTVRQQLLVFKVAAFILIELVAFPLGCGVCLDLCTMWLFPQVSPFTRAIYFFQAPLTSMFYHWVAGTMFMYSFAILLSGCRSIMRPGAMWFIKDPQDQNSHPIRDILDRPAFTQLRKIFVSGLMYSFVVFCVVSSFAALLFLGRRSILPFRWKTREPLSHIPVDLLFLHLVLPYTVHYFRPRKTVKTVSLALWRALARRLRLSSYFFGGRYLVEEYPPKSFLLNFLKPADLLDPLGVRDGSLRRVPATDHIALPKDMRATAAVNENGEPIDEVNKRLIDNQNAEAARANRMVKDDYTIVYLPPAFRYRISAFIALLWIVGAVFFGVAVALPVLLGRGFFHLWVPYEVHDGYSFIAGLYLLWACYLFGRAIDKLDKRRQRHGEEGPRADLRILVLKRGSLWVLKITYLAFFLGFVLPTLVSIVMELYVVLPLRLAVNPSLSPKLRIVDAWALGLLYAKIGLFVQRAQPNARINQGLRRIMNNGWTHPDPITATKEVIGPMLLGLSAMITAPALLFLLGNRFLPFLQLSTKSTFIYVYPAIFVLAGFSSMAKVFYGTLSAWSQTVRDKEFLVEMRLQNHEPSSTENT